jgi:hypothetical protein
MPFALYTLKSIVSLTLYRVSIKITLSVAGLGSSFQNGSALFAEIVDLLSASKDLLKITL